MGSAVAALGRRRAGYKELGQRTLRWLTLVLRIRQVIKRLRVCPKMHRLSA